MSDSKISFIQDIFGSTHLHKNTKELGIFCPFCFHKNKKLFINLKNDYWHCFVCEKAGKSLFSLLKKTNATANQIDDYSKYYRAKNVLSQTTFDKTFKPTLPKEYRPLATTKRTITTNRFFEYLERRNISQETILLYKLGFCQSGDFQDRIILPSFDRSGNLNFFTARDITRTF